MASPDYLFVYGTLRKGYETVVKDSVSELLQYVGKGKVKAVMYDIGDFPGAVKSSGPGEVIGDVYEVKNPANTFLVLDRYEGFRPDNPEASDYIRVQTKVMMNRGDQVNAWIYWCNLDLEGKPVISNKDYLRYLKKKAVD